MLVLAVTFPRFFNFLDTKYTKMLKFFLVAISFVQVCVSEGIKDLHMHVAEELEDEQLSQAYRDNITEASEASLSSNELSLIHDYAKNISHSKGPFMTSDKNDTMQQEDNLQLRRSLIRKVGIASESEILKELLHSFNNSTEDKIVLLEKITDLVHQYDVAINFANMGGIQLLFPYLYSPNEKVVSAVVSVLGAAMQGNPVVQKVAVQLNLNQHLMKLLHESSPDLCSSVLFALSSYLRNMPDAQRKFLSEDGVSVLAKILKNHILATNTKLKVINLLSDLAVEHEMEQMYEDDDNVRNETLKKLFTSKVQKSNICHLIPDFLELEDFDTHQKVIAAMNSLYPVCKTAFEREEIIYKIMKLFTIYDPLTADKNPLYPIIDTELKEMLTKELKILYSNISSEITNRRSENEKYAKQEL